MKFGFPVKIEGFSSPPWDGRLCLSAGVLGTFAPAVVDAPAQGRDGLWLSPVQQKQM